MQRVEAPEVVSTPAIGLLHPLAPERYFESPRAYLDWRLSDAVAAEHGDTLATHDAPRVAVLLFRKHVITEQTYSPRGRSADGSRRRRGCDVDVPRRRVATTPRLRRGCSAETRVATTPRLRRGCSAETSRGDAAARWTFH